MAYNNKKVLYFDVMLLFTSNADTFDSPNSQYLEIFGFIRIDFMYFSNNGFVGIHSVFHKQQFFSLPIIHNKKLLRQILLQTVAQNLKQYCFKRLFFTVFSIFNVIGF